MIKNKFLKWCGQLPKLFFLCGEIIDKWPKGIVRYVRFIKQFVKHTFKDICYKAWKIYISEIKDIFSQN